MAIKPNFNISEKLFSFGNILVIIGFFLSEISPAFLSVGTAFIVLSNFIDRTKKPQYFPFIYLVCLWFLFLLSYFYVSNTEKWAQKISTSLPLFILSLSFIYSNKTNVKKYLVFLVYTVSLFALASLINLMLNYERLSEGIVHSKQIPVWPEGKGVSHIYFSVLQSFSVLFCLYTFIQKDWQKSFHRNSVLFLGLFNFAALHILSSRTGLVALYLSMFIVVIFYFITHQKALKYSWLIPVFAILPFIAYLSIGTFRARVENTVTDLKIMKNGEDINHRSFAMRIEASKNGIEIIKEFPLLGVGYGDLDSAMQVKYKERNTSLWLENRILPHNQFIETFANCGIFAFILLSLFLLSFIFMAIKDKNFLLLSTSLLFVFSFTAESMIERQVGVIFFIWVLGMIFLDIKYDENQIFEKKAKNKEEKPRVNP